MNDQQEKKSEEQTPKKSKRKKWWVILAIFACMVVYTEFIADERISPQDKVNEILFSTRHRIYDNVNRDGAIVTKFPDRWDWWSDKFEFKKLSGAKRDDNYISNYRVRYEVEILIAGTRLETDVVVDVVINETTGTYTIRDIDMREYNRYVGQLLQQLRK